MSPPFCFRRIELAPNYPAWEIETPQCRAVLAEHGAHLIHWQPTHAVHPVLYNSPESVYREGKAIRGGIPVCWPWFNAHPTDPAAHPSHGVARNRFWRVEEMSLNGDGAAVMVLSLPPDEKIRKHVPFDFTLKARFVIGTILRVELSTDLLSGTADLVGGALHTYLAVSSVESAVIRGLSGAHFFDTTQKPFGESFQASEPLKVAAEIDRIYDRNMASVTLEDAGWERRIRVDKEGSFSTVVWNPWTEKAAALADLPDEDYRRFVCVEAANAGHDAPMLSAGQSSMLATTLTVESM